MGAIKTAFSVLSSMFSGSSVLGPILRIKVPASDTFIAGKDFSSTKTVNVVGDNFPKWFLAANNNKGKIEKAMDSHEICYSDLKESLRNHEIIGELNHFNYNCETFLVEIYYLINRQEGYSRGRLSLDADNFFFVYDSMRTLRLVRLFWENGGLCISAIKTDDRNKRSKGCRIFFSPRTELEITSDIPVSSEESLWKNIREMPLAFT